MDSIAAFAIYSLLSLFDLIGMTSVVKLFDTGTYGAGTLCVKYGMSSPACNELVWQGYFVLIAAGIGGYILWRRIEKIRFINNSNNHTS